MAYLDFADGMGGAAVLAPAREARPSAVAVTPVADPVPAAREAKARLSALEWSIVAIAERDRLSTLRTPGRTSMAMRLLFGERPNPRLADPRLEALRRIAVLSWHHGYTIPSAEVRGFLAAGFSPDQYELVVDSIGVARADAAARRFDNR